MLLVFVVALCGLALASPPGCVTRQNCGVHGHDIGGKQNTDLVTCEAECAANPECKFFVFRTKTNRCGFKGGGMILDVPGRPNICGECQATTAAPTAQPVAACDVAEPSISATGNKRCLASKRQSQATTQLDCACACQEMGFNTMFWKADSNTCHCPTANDCVAYGSDGRFAEFEFEHKYMYNLIHNLDKQIESLTDKLTELDAKLGTIAGSLNQYQNTTDATISSLVYNNTIVDANLHVTEKLVETLRHVVYGHRGIVAQVDHELNESFSCDERHVNSFQRCATQEQYLANGGLYAYQNQSESQMYVRRKTYRSGQVRYETGTVSNHVCQLISQVGRRRLSEEELEEMYESAGLTDDERAQVQEHHDHVQSSERGRQLLGFINCLQCTHSYRKASPTGELLIGEAVIPFTRTSPICPKNVGRPDLFGTSQFTTDKWLCVKDEHITGPNRKYDGVTIDWVSCNTFEIIDFVDRITTSPTMAPPPVGR